MSHIHRGTPYSGWPMISGGKVCINVHLSIGYKFLHTDPPTPPLSSQDPGPQRGQSR